MLAAPRLRPRRVRLPRHHGRGAHVGDDARRPRRRQRHVLGAAHRAALRPLARPLPFATLCCAFNGKALYANLQRETSAAATWRALDDPTLYKALDAHLVKSLQLADRAARAVATAHPAPSRSASRPRSSSTSAATARSSARPSRSTPARTCWRRARSAGERVTGSAVSASSSSRPSSGTCRSGTRSRASRTTSPRSPPAVLDALLKAAPCSGILRCRATVKLAVRARVCRTPTTSARSG